MSISSPENTKLKMNHVVEARNSPTECFAKNCLIFKLFTSALSSGISDSKLAIDRISRV